jgi:hypothetical protein
MFWMYLYNEGLQLSYLSSNVIRLIKSRRINAYKIFVGIPERKRTWKTQV